MIAFAQAVQTHGALCLAFDVWCVAFDVWCVAFDVWCVVSGAACGRRGLALQLPPCFSFGVLGWGIRGWNRGFSGFTVQGLGIQV